MELISKGAITVPRCHTVIVIRVGNIKQKNTGTVTGQIPDKVLQCHKFTRLVMYKKLKQSCHNSIKESYLDSHENQ